MRRGKTEELLPFPRAQVMERQTNRGPDKHRENMSCLLLASCVECFDLCLCTSGWSPAGTFPAGSARLGWGWQGDLGISTLVSHTEWVRRDLKIILKP